MAVVLLIAGLACLGVLIQEYLEARDTLRRLEARQARLQRLQKPDAAQRQRQTTAGSAPAGDAALARMATQLQFPWDALFRHIESTTDSTVSLLSVDIQAQSRRAHIVGEARTMAVVVDYVMHLRASPLVSAATLSSHEERQVGAFSTIRFSIELALGGAP